jgi:hypothetical protein
MPGTGSLILSEQAPPSQLIQAFAQSPGLAGIAMRKALDRTPGKFLEAVIRDTAQDTESRGFRYALMLLRDAGMLVAALAQPASTSFEQACRITGALLEMDPGFAAALLDAALTRRDLCDTACRLRILDLIGKFPERVPSWRPVVKLYESGDARVKSRSAALLARYNYRERAAKARFEEADPRGRADMLEALPPDAGATVRDLLVQSLSDSDSRVAGNACLALYRAGDLRALSTLARMLEEGTHAERLTAAWVMGDLRDLRFAPLLRRAAATNEPDLRKRAFRSLGALERPEAAPVSGMQVIPVSHTCKGGFNEVWSFVLAADQEHFVPALRPVDFIPAGTHGTIVDYSVDEIGHPVPVSFRAGMTSVAQMMSDVLFTFPAREVWNITPFGAVSAARKGICKTGKSFAWVHVEANAERHLAMLADETSDLDFESLKACSERMKIQFHLLNSPPRTTTQAQAIAWFLEAFNGRYVIRTPAHQPVRSIMIRDAASTPVSFSTRNSVSVPKEVS